LPRKVILLSWNGEEDLQNKDIQEILQSKFEIDIEVEELKGVSYAVTKIKKKERVVPGVKKSSGIRRPSEVKKIERKKSG